MPSQKINAETNFNEEEFQRQIKKGIMAAVESLENEAYNMQNNAVNDVYQSAEFTQIYDNMKGHIEKEGDEIQEQFD